MEPWKTEYRRQARIALEKRIEADRRREAEQALRELSALLYRRIWVPASSAPQEVHS